MLRIKYERVRRGISQKHVAKRALLTQPEVSEIENGVMRPSAAKLRRLVDIFRLPADELLKEVVVLEPWR